MDNIKTQDKTTAPDWQAVKKNLEARYPAGIPRTQIGEATGGILHPRTLSNRDSQGTGIKGKFKIGKQVIYPVSAVVADMMNMMKQVV